MWELQVNTGDGWCRLSSSWEKVQLEADIRRWQQNYLPFADAKFQIVEKKK